MFTVVADIFENSSYYNLYIIDTATNEKVDTLLNQSFEEVVDYILKNRDEIHKVNYVYHNQFAHVMNVKSQIIN